jgi:YidC/Oxa1 family membrane protein insertase
MFYFFPAVFELRGESFLWAEDLSTYDSLIHWETSIPVLGTHLSLFTILMTISTLIYTKIQNEVSGATGQMKYIGYIMPVIFLGVLNSYASGLTYYYLLLNLITFAQQAILKRSIDENKLHAQIAENKQKGGKTKSKFQQRLEEMQAVQNKRKK